MNAQVMQWTKLDAPLSGCDVASAAATPDGSVRCCGVREPGERPGSQRVRLLHQVVLAREAAGALRTMIARLLADAGQGRA